MKKIFTSKLFLILCGPVLGILGIWLAVALVIEGMKATFPLILFIVLWFITLVDGLYHFLNKDIKLIE